MPVVSRLFGPFFGVLIGVWAAAPAWSADFSDPTWPCVQRKIENLSMGLMWPHPVALDTAVASDVLELSETLALRRVALEDAAAAVEAFAARHDGDPEVLGQVFARVFAALSTRRARIIQGIGEFSLGQIALAKKIDATRQEMDRLMAADAPDYDKVDKLEEQLDWDQVIFSDRQRSITYLCETPVLLEQRLFGIAQMMQAVLRDDG